MSKLLRYIHALESLQNEMRVNSDFIAARTLEDTIEFLRGEYATLIVQHENRSKVRVN